MLYLNGEPVKVTIFPDNTSQVWKLPYRPESIVVISWEFDHEGEIMHLAQLVDLLRTGAHPDIILDLPYLPYGRQDKKISNTSTFALRTFGYLLMDFDFAEVHVLDPHSEVLGDYVNLRPIYPEKQLKEAVRRSSADLVCYPDSGAFNKYSKVYHGFPIVHASKVRDGLTGDILSTDLIGDVKGKNVMIVDDICDGGATFIALSKVLKQNGAENVDLFVSHGLFTKGLKPLLEAGIRNIFTAKGTVSRVHDTHTILPWGQEIKETR